MRPMLARSSDIKKIDKFINDPDYWFQQKLDGIRILITVEDGKVSGVGRSGRAVSLPPEAVDPFVDLAALWQFDGEFIGTGEGTLWLFDMPRAGGHLVTPDSPYHVRAQALETTYNLLFPDGSDDIKVVEVAKTTEEKQTLFDWCRSNFAEGVMLKEINSKYLPGTRSPFMLKMKFVETADVVILEVRREGKESIAVGAFDENGKLVDVGSVKLTESQGLNNAVVGQVCEVRYLNMSKDRRIYQPVWVGFRPDKLAVKEDCSISQFKFVNKAVRDA